MSTRQLLSWLLIAGALILNGAVVLWGYYDDLEATSVTDRVHLASGVLALAVAMFLFAIYFRDRRVALNKLRQEQCRHDVPHQPSKRRKGGGRVG